MSTTHRSPSGLTVIRRLYFYVVAFISAVASLAALDQLVKALDQVWLGGQALYDVGGGAFIREVLASSGGVLIVAVPIFLLHWRIIQKRQQDIDERHSSLRKLFLYLTSAVIIGFALFRAYSLINGIAALAFGQPVSTSDIWPSGWLRDAITLAVAIALEVYFRHILLADGDYGHEIGSAGVWRRLFRVVVGLTGLGLMLFGAAGILETAWRTATRGIGVQLTGSETWWYDTLANGIALLLIGAVLSRLNWQRWHAVAAQNTGEARSALRRFYLYVAVLVGAVATLTPAASILREALLLAFGTGAADSADLMQKLAAPISFVLPGLAVWVWHRRFLQQEADQHGESQEGAVVRRLYYYVVAAAGIALLWFGLIDTASALLGALLGGLWVEPLATGLSLLTVGAPVWALHWRAVQRVARGDDAEGLAERASLTRRAYLYGVALVGALLILFYLARVVYRFLLFVLGDPNAGMMTGQTVDEIARAAISAALWSVHILAIRTDGRMGEIAPPPTAVTPQPADERVWLVQRIGELERELDATREALRQLEAEQDPLDAPQ